jgi:hypothetical protein
MPLLQLWRLIRSRGRPVQQLAILEEELLSIVFKVSKTVSAFAFQNIEPRRDVCRVVCADKNSIVLAVDHERLVNNV